MAFIEVGKVLYNTEGESYEVQAIDKTDSGVDYVHLLKGDDILCYMSVEMAKEILSEKPSNITYDENGFLTEESAEYLLKWAPRKNYTHSEGSSRYWQIWDCSVGGEDFTIETYDESGLSRTRISIYEDDPEFGPFLSTVWVRERQ